MLNLTAIYDTVNDFCKFWHKDVDSVVYLEI